MSAKTLQLIDSTIEDNFIAVFSKSYCPYCRRAKTLINNLELPEGKTVQIYEYVPFVFPAALPDRLVINHFNC
jgi:glutaredoxin 3